jgi:outer membrane protein
MKLMIKNLLVVLSICIVTTVAWGQGSAVKSAAAGNNKPAAGNIPVLTSGKVAVIDSRNFGEGIGEMKKQLDRLDTEFQPRTKELEGLQAQLLKLEEEIKVGGGGMKPEVLRQKSDQMTTLKKEFERKREDYQSDIQKRYELVLGPIQEKLRKFLESYASAREIVVVLDLAPAAQAGLLFLNPGINITEEFIKEYNKQNPVTP